MIKSSPVSVNRPEIAADLKENDANFLLHLSSSPHIRHAMTVPYIMKNVIIGLIPATIGAVLFFRVQAVILILLSVLAAVATEWALCLLLKRTSTLNDFSAAVTGLLLALCMPPGIAWWMVIAGSIFAIAVIKIPFGGLGYNFVNPALAARAFLMISFPIAMFSQWRIPSWGALLEIDGVSSATPLNFFKHAVQNGIINLPDLKNSLLPLVIGNVGGCIGETSVIALLLGAAWLVYKRIIDLKIPLSFIATTFILFWLFNGSGELFTEEAIFIPLFQICAGGLMLGAFFMATDTVTSPITSTGKLLFGCGCGFFTFIIRKYTGFTEGVCFAILLMNLSVPILEKYTKPKINGSAQFKGNV